MIRLENLSMDFRRRGKRKLVAKGINATFPSGRAVALLGRNGAGKSTLLKIIAGTMEPTAGRVVSSGTISWPVGFAGSFHPHLSGVQNARFVARIYGADSRALVDFVEDFAALGDHFRLPVSTYSAGMRSRLAFGVSMGLRFDTYLVDEVTSVGDAAFRAKSACVFRTRMEDAGAIVVSHSMIQVKELCDMGAVLENGDLTLYEDLDEAIAHHQRVMSTAA
ncbi:ABC transporter ATP-binding protein [Pseudooceanicola algae]|uniref:Polysialic acid transport ATP-binding protein KpsT n=1 Tax=Pseudooceanicola algae TaxID=1537215 RepID=A0A418SKV8_9RHOB|nr:ABC transporter ATP-binding protein [Pseudooceanicola algae]QPM90952.1 Polysialic acid transport ATP-binding protein KpsT [Pseudooceanicola algae]